MKKNYWLDYWNKHATNLEGLSSQERVLRTKKKQPINNADWDKTLNIIDANINIKQNETILDLCAGNGLLAKHFAKKCKSVYAVDFSKDLLKEIDDSNYSNIKTINKDMRLVEFEQDKFDKIIIYAGIQYISVTETIELFEKIKKWLKPQGTIYIGDIPDENKIWSFFNNKERREIYFENKKNNKQIVGTWFTKEFFGNLSEYIGFSSCKIINQDDFMIYSHFRFDIKIIK